MEFPRNQRTSQPVGWVVIGALGLWLVVVAALVAVMAHFVAKFW